MYNFDELDTLTDRLIGEEIQAYDLPYYIEPLLEGTTLIDLLKTYLNDAITHKNASRTESAIILAGGLGEDKKLLPQYENLLLETWHHSHEDLVDIIESYGNASNIATLQKAFNLSLPYMEYYHHYSFHRKLLYAILKLAPEQFASIHKQYIAALKKGIILK
ncbi:hypothetical protein [uncultured Capnocytophaga sp.]|uniref:hypothetical protein n=1 Tax=uncultured Capnocytophaga sp. TaxID=159273 RepID=UPI00262ACF29|nr:hypothetical protein [uncultured Capnocytophaga sp.]